MTRAAIRPNLFIAGAPKCGTTSLAGWLDQHPEVRVSPVKEPNFFNDDIAYSTFEDEDAYLAHFGSIPCHVRRIADATPLYLMSETAAAAIARFDSAARIIIMLRDPAEMAVSLHAEMLAAGRETERDFARAWALQEERAAGRSVPLGAIEPKLLLYRSACAIGSQGERFLDSFPREQIRFILLDDIRRDAAGELAALCDWLGLAPMPATDLSVRNARHHARSRGVGLALGLLSSAQARGILPKGRTGLGRLARNLNRAPGPDAVVDPAFMREVVRPAFADEVERIRRLTKRALPDWGLGVPAEPR